MTKRIDYKRSVRKDLRKLDRQAAGRVARRLRELLNAEGVQHEPLSGEYGGFYRLRIGDYRVVYRIGPEGYFIVRVAQEIDAGDCDGPRSYRG